jgi:DNA-binding NarL/FixJ family response regulator
MADLRIFLADDHAVVREGLKSGMSGAKATEQLRHDGSQSICSEGHRHVRE